MRRLILAAVFMAMAAPVMAQDRAPPDLRVLREAPGSGQLRRGESVLVDDGSCPTGQIRMITAGNNRGRSSGGGERQSSCVLRN
jgi:hypothetical protein